MFQHPFFDLQLHDDAELSVIMGSTLVERTTLHEWPLSCVQRIRTEDGRSRIYKVQAPPTVEPLFYARARSPLLAEAQVVEQAGAPPALLLEALTSPRLADLKPSPVEALAMAHAVTEQITRIEGELPAIADIRTEAKWSSFVTALRDDLTSLVGGGAFQHVDGPLIDRLLHHATAPTIFAALRSQSGYVHLDLKSDNVFVLPGGYRVIDWQRPIWGPIALDLASLIESLGLDPRPHVMKGVTPMLALLRIAWMAQCARHWFPPGVALYDASIARLAAQIEA
jgi:hypothetical protein